MIASFVRGHAVEYRNEAWVYADNGQPVDDLRPCPKCGEMPTAEGYDACLGFVHGVSSACCGHGVDPPYQVHLNESERK